MPQDDLATEWKSFDEVKRTRLLSKMSPEQKKKLRGLLEGKTAAPATPALPSGPEFEIESEQKRYKESGPITRFLSSFESGFGIPQSVQEHPATAARGIGLAVRHPGLEVESLKQMWNSMSEAQQNLIDRAYLKQHAPGMKNKAEGFVLGVYSALPIVGPAIVNAVDQWNSGDKAGGAGSLAAVMSQFFVKDAAERVAKLPVPKLPNAEGIRQFTQRLVGTGKRPVEDFVRAKAKTADVKAAKVAEQNVKIAATNADATAQAQAPVLEQKAHAEALTRRATTEKELSNASSKFQAQVETARVKALKVGNEKYSAVNAKLSPIAGDTGQLTEALHDSLSRITGTEAQPTILKSISDRLELAQPSGVGGISYADLQGYYSELGRELSKGTLPGDIYNAYDTMHEAIGEQMQAIADAHGAGEQLTDARAYWKHMKQTFGRPPSLTDVASMTLKEVVPEYMEQQARANRLRNLGYFDFEIPQTAEAIDRLRESLKGPAPKESSGTSVPTLKPLKKIETPEVNTRQVREQLLRKWAASGEKVSPWRLHILLAGGLGGLFTALFGRPELGAAEAIGAAGVALGPPLIARLTENAGVREWLTRPPVDELKALQQLPNADRLRIVDALNQVVQASQKTRTPIKVSAKFSRISGFVPATGRPAPRQHPSDEYSDPRQLQPQ